MFNLGFLLLISHPHNWSSETSSIDTCSKFQILYETQNYVFKMSYFYLPYNFLFHEEVFPKNFKLTSLLLLWLPPFDIFIHFTFNTFFFWRKYAFIEEICFVRETFICFCVFHVTGRFWTRKCCPELLIIIKTTALKTISRNLVLANLHTAA